jgi:hypothetical protein
VAEKRIATKAPGHQVTPRNPINQTLKKIL